MNVKLNHKNEETLKLLQEKFPTLKPRHWSEIFNKILAGIPQSKFETLAVSYKPEKETLKAIMADDDLKNKILKIIENHQKTTDTATDTHEHKKQA
jgi:hypothetical protein